MSGGSEYRSDEAPTARARKRQVETAITTRDHDSQEKDRAWVSGHVHETNGNLSCRNRSAVVAVLLLGTMMPFTGWADAGSSPDGTSGGDAPEAKASELSRLG
jgi:hypothetical protein